MCSVIGYEERQKNYCDVVAAGLRHGENSNLVAFDSAQSPRFYR